MADSADDSDTAQQAGRTEVAADAAGRSPHPTPDDAGFRTWVAVRMAPLRRKAYFLTGDWDAADDLVQDSLITVYVRWSRVARGRNVDAYMNRVMMSRHLDTRRRPWRRERVVDLVPERRDDHASAAFAAVDEHDDRLAAALAALPASQRAVLVLRYTDDLALEEIADVLRLPIGTVKSRLSRGSEAVRRDLTARGIAPPGSAEPTPVLAMEGRHEH